MECIEESMSLIYYCCTCVRIVRVPGEWELRSGRDCAEWEKNESPVYSVHIYIMNI